MPQAPDPQNPSDSTTSIHHSPGAPADLATFARTDTPRQRPRRLWTRFFVAGLVLAFVALLAESAFDSLRPSREVTIVRPMPLAATASASGGTVRVTEATGFVEPDPEPFAVVARREGVFATVLKRSGDTVAAGEVLATLDAADAEIELRVARDLIATAHDAVAAATTERDLATTAHTLALELSAARRIAETELAAAREVEAQRKSAIAGAESARDGAALELERERELATAGVSGPSRVELARIRLATADSEVAMRRAEAAEAGALRARAEIAAEAATAAETQRFDRATALARAEREVATARSDLVNATARLEVAELTMERSELRSPCTGLVARVTAIPGARTMPPETTHRAEPAFVLFDPMHLRCRVDVPLAQVGGIAIGQPAIVTPEGSQRAFRGEVIRITGEADVQKVALRVHVKLLESGSELIPERICRVEIRNLGGGSGDSLPSSSPALSIPRAALRDDGSLLVLDIDGTRAERRVVTLASGAASAPDIAIVTAGLDPSDKVIVEHDVAPGDRVAPRAKRGHQ